MTQAKQLWLLAGGNGAGKSTFYNQFLKPQGIKFVNADLIAKQIDPVHPENVSYEAANVAIRIIEDLLLRGVSFCYETVFSHVSKIDLVAKARALKYEIVLVYIHLDSPELNEARVSQRVAEGGHNVSAEKIHSRIPRTMKNIAKALLLADEARILNNSSLEDAYKQVAVMKNGEIKKLVDPFPKWAEDILSECLVRE